MSGPLVKITRMVPTPNENDPGTQSAEGDAHAALSPLASTNKHWWTYSAPEWTESKDLKVGDLVLFPVVKETKDLSFLPLPEKGKLANQSESSGNIGRDSR